MLKINKKGGLLICLLLLNLSLVGCSDSSIESKKITENNAPKTSNTSNAHWVESSLFKVGNYSMIGEEGRLGFIYDDSDIDKFYPNRIQKYMWHFWGSEQELKGTLKVLATHESENTSIVLLEGSLGSENNGADRHLPSNLSLPKSGMWKLDAYIGDNLFGTIYVKVHENSSED